MTPLTATTSLVDRELAEVAASVDALGDVTPTNAEEAWARSAAVGHREELVLRYRHPRTPVDRALGALAELPVDEVEDEWLRALFVAERDELVLQARLVDARETEEFLARSHDLYGTADDRLLALAEELLDRVPPPAEPSSLATPDEFAERARAEIDRYRSSGLAFDAEVQVRHDVPSLMVVQRDLLVGADSWLPEHRVEALLQHEVGTHLLTAENGGRQPIQLLEQGLAGHEETQEALGVLAEHLVEGIDAERVRTIAARALAARRCSDGAGFPDLFAELHERHGFPERAAYTIAMRIVRGGGFTKDVIYLRGFIDLVTHLAGGGALEPMLVGKFHLRQVAAIEALLAAGVLHPPVLLPRWLEGAGPARRLAALRETSPVEVLLAVGSHPPRCD